MLLSCYTSEWLNCLNVTGYTPNYTGRAGSQQDMFTLPFHLLSHLSPCSHLYNKYNLLDDRMNGGYFFHYTSNGDVVKSRHLAATCMHLLYICT